MIHIVLFYEPPLISAHTEINSNLWDGENVAEIPPNMGPILTSSPHQPAL